MDFKHAIKEAMSGKKIRRSCWASHLYVAYERNVWFVVEEIQE